MLVFHVNDMTCGHCASTITKAVKAVDQDAKVTIDLAQHRVSVELAAAGPDDIRDAISDAGYTPQPVHVAHDEVAASKPRCCGS